ncbi:MAG: type IX secretion system membrane protein PorP/SprF, partial [Bacteroidales bacterium]|nr:type IX secretion system membrane protein PorP/SprF [Bacteroidales bacterium]
IDDAAVPVTRVNSLRIDPKFGLFLYSDRFYAGLSSTDLLGDLIQAPDGFAVAQQRHYYLTAGYVFDLGEDVKLKPSFLIREDFKALTNFDVSTYVLFKETFWLGATYRFGADLVSSETLDNSLKSRDALVFMTEWNINPSFVIGYAYTHSLTALSGFSGHEIMLDYTLPRKLETRMKTPRYF